MASKEELQQISILIVDDERFQRRILRETLRGAGFPNVREADSGQAAAATFYTQNFGLILSDVQMPGMNGLELLRQIRTGRTRGPRDLRFIIMTSYSNTEVLGTAVALDVNGFMVKPIKIGVVMDHIVRAVSEGFTLRAEHDYEAVTTDLPSLRGGRQEAYIAPMAGLSATEELETEPGIKRLSLPQLRKGMRLARDLVAKDGTLLLVAGFTLNEVSLNRLWDLSANVLAENIFWVHHSDDRSRGGSVTLPR